MTQTAKVTYFAHGHQPPRTLDMVLPHTRLNGKIGEKALIPKPQGQHTPNYNWNITQQIFSPFAMTLAAFLPFNMSPTAMLWLEDHARTTHDRFIEADRESRLIFQDHGTAQAQFSLNHVIAPLATDRDIDMHTQWSKRFFQSRFERDPEGMWLPETAVNLKTLGALNRHGIKYVVLSPYQAIKIRKLEDHGQEDKWIDVFPGLVDPSRAYTVDLGDGESIAAFFYDKDASVDIGYQGTFHDGHHLLGRMKSLVNESRDHVQILHSANDMETGGHHRGSRLLRALIGMVDSLDSDHRHETGLELTTYGLYLAQNPPKWEVKLEEYTSWSCSHHLGRYGQLEKYAGFERADCTCSDEYPIIDSIWRKQLREAIDIFNEKVDQVYVEIGSRYLNDPWAALTDYISVVVGTKPLVELIDGHAKDSTSRGELNTKVAKLLRMKELALIASGSDIYFHDGFGRSEAWAQFAAIHSALKIMEDLTGNDEGRRVFLESLEKVQHGGSPNNAVLTFMEAVEIVDRFTTPVNPLVEYVI